MRKFNTNEDDFIKANYLLIPAKRMAKMIGRADSTVRQRMALIGLKTPVELVERFKAESRYKKGRVAENKGKKQTDWLSVEGINRSRKTRFKKGHAPANTKTDGAISVRTDHKARNGRQYKWIRIKKAKWKQYSHYRWEKYRGKIPKGKILMFINGDTLDCRLKNLKLIDRAKNMKRNSIHRLPKEIGLTIQLMGALQRQINKHEKQNKRSA